MTEYAYIIGFIGQRWFGGRGNIVEDIHQDPALLIRGMGAEHISDMLDFSLQIHVGERRMKKGKYWRQNHKEEKPRGSVDSQQRKHAHAYYFVEERGRCGDQGERT